MLRKFDKKKKGNFNLLFIDFAALHQLESYRYKLKLIIISNNCKPIFLKKTPIPHHVQRKTCSAEKKLSIQATKTPVDDQKMW